MKPPDKSERGGDVNVSSRLDDRGHGGGTEEQPGRHFELYPAHLRIKTYQEAGLRVSTLEES